jgi:penicillin V acylase-like amidase (Ntn superfamily)
VDFFSYCTSVVARRDDGKIIHARNLDFDFPEVMKKIVYKAKYY